MSSESLNTFLKALDAVKKDYTCVVCAQFCKNPVTLSKCFHMICSEHFNKLKVCPSCDTSLEGCTTFQDTGLSSCVEATKVLDTYFQTYVANLSATPDDAAVDKTIQNHISQNTGTAVKNTKKATGNKNEENMTTSINVEPSRRSPNRSKNLNLKQNTSSGKRAIKSSEKTEDTTNLSSKTKRKANVLSDNDTNTGNKDVIKKITQVESDKKLRNKNQKMDSESTSSKKISKAAENCSNITNISAGSKINKANEKRNNKGETLLHIACRLAKVDRIIDLLEQGANTNTKDNAGWTPLHEVVQNGRLDLVRLLLQYNALIDVPGQGNETPLHEAIRYNHVDIAVELVKHGADINARNCKGETPYQLAPLDMKTTLLEATENVIQTQSLNITRMSLLHSELDFDDIRVYCVSQFRTISSRLKSLAKIHSNLNIESKFNKKATHFIVDTENGVCASSLDVLQGIVNSLWILSSDWITKSSEDSLEPFEKYEVIGVGNKTYNGPRNARYNKYKQLPGIFDGCHFYLHDFNSKYEISSNLVLTKASLAKLITDAGGVVLHRVPNPEAIPDQEKLVPYHAKKDGKLVNCTHYIIFKDMYQPMYNMHHLKALPIGWLIECLEKYELCEPWDLQ